MPSSPPTFGLTGSVACGKSTVARFFHDLGARIVDADRVGHELIEPGRPSYAEILHRFGEEIRGADGAIDRKKLGARVFASPEELDALNAILHPRIMARVDDLAREQYALDPRAVVIVDAALVFESRIGGMTRKVIVAWCRPEQQMERLMAKTGVSRQEAEQRIQAQMPQEEKCRRADYLIDCSTGLGEARRQAEKLFPELQRLAAERG
jgi:dephospho-CoA kinase